jgi:hypothetical protein
MDKDQGGPSLSHFIYLIHYFIRCSGKIYSAKIFLVVQKELGILFDVVLCADLKKKN